MQIALPGMQLVARQARAGVDQWRGHAGIHAPLPQVRAAADRRLAEQAAQDVAAGRLDPHTAAARLVDGKIAALPDRQRQALSLVYFEGLTNIEAADAMEVSVDALESLLARARRSLKDSLSAAFAAIDATMGLLSPLV